MVTENPPVFPQELRDCDSSILARQVDSLKLLTGLSFFLAISTRRNPIIYVAYIDGKLESSFVKLKVIKKEESFMLCNLTKGGNMKSIMKY